MRGYFRQRRHPIQHRVLFAPKGGLMPRFGTMECDVTDKERYDAFAAEFMQRFDEMVRWAIVHWPNEKFPLMESDFTQSRREISQILGPKLGEPETPRASPAGSGQPQYFDVDPAPWP